MSGHESADADEFESLRAVVGTGAGLVARVRGAVIVAADLDDERLQELVQLCTEAGGASHPADALAKTIGSWPGSNDPEVTVGILAPAGRELRLFVHGNVALIAAQSRFLRSRPGQAWMVETVPWPAGSLTLGVSGTATAVGAPWGLREGVVPGGNVTLVAAHVLPQLPPVIQGADAPPQPILEYPVPLPPAGQSLLLDPAPARGRFESLLVPVEEPPRAPLASGLEDPGPSAPFLTEAAEPPAGEHEHADHHHTEVNEYGESGPVEARGFLCSRDHFNDPRVRFCGFCGIRMDERTNLLISRPRPPLGLLVFDDGSTYQVDGDYLLGRAPDTDPRVTGGEMRPLMLSDPQGRMSRVHAAVTLQEWDAYVVDQGSVNGTYVMLPGQTTWMPVPANAALHIPAGSRVGMGDRSFVFESVFGVG